MCLSCGCGKPNDDHGLFEKKQDPHSVTKTEKRGELEITHDLKEKESIPTNFVAETLTDEGLIQQRIYFGDVVALPQPDGASAKIKISASRVPYGELWSNHGFLIGHIRLEIYNPGLWSCQGAWKIVKTKDAGIKGEVGLTNHAMTSLGQKNSINDTGFAFNSDYTMLETKSTSEKGTRIKFKPS